MSPTECGSIGSPVSPGKPEIQNSGAQMMQAMIDKYYYRMPNFLKVGYYDVMILYSEVDREAAEEYKEHLQRDILLEKGHRVKCVLYDDDDMISLAGSKIKALEYGFQRCTFAFVYLTKSFCDCEWCAFSSEECLMEAIYNKEKKWCVVPVYTVARNKADFKIPMGLNSLKGVNFYNNDDFYRRGMRRLIGDKLHVRLKKESDHLDARYRWSCEEKNRLEALEITRQQRVAMEQRRNEELRRQLASRKIDPPSEEVPLKSDQYSHPSPQKMKSLPLGDESLKKGVEYSRAQSEHSMFTCPTSSGPSEGEDLSQPHIEPSSLDDMPSLDDGHTRHVPHVQSVLRSPHTDLPHGISPTATKEQVIVREIHEHHHHYGQPEPKVTNINIVGAQNVIVGPNGTIVGGHAPSNSSDGGNDDIILNTEEKQVSGR